MATIKSFTSLEQSKKLAEILPLESADMCYILHASSDNPDWRFDNDIPPMVLGKISINELTVKALSCWSLTALLSVLDFPCLTQENENEWEVCVFDHDNDGYIEKTANNPVDACYEMILKLNELKLL